MFTKLAALASGFLAAMTLSAGAAVLTFDTPFNGPVYTEAGMTITAAPGTENVNVESGYLGFSCCDPPKTLNWSLTTGGLFNLDSINVIHVDSVDPVTFTGLLAGATIATQIFTSNVGLFNFTGFTGLDEVIISATMGDFADPKFDDLSYSVAAIPLPAALPLLLAALGGLALLRRRNTAV